MDFVFRAATEADLEVLVSMEREYYLFDHIPFDEGVSRRALNQLIREPLRGCVWLIVDDQEPVGYLVVTFGYSLEYGGGDAFIDELFVVDSHRRRGIGTQALRVAEAACRERGIRALHLEVERTNLPAQEVYRRAGFVDHDRYLMTRFLESDQADETGWRGEQAGGVN